MQASGIPATRIAPKPENSAGSNIIPSFFSEIINPENTPCARHGEVKTPKDIIVIKEIMYSLIIFSIPLKFLSETQRL